MCDIINDTQFRVLFGLNPREWSNISGERNLEPAWVESEEGAEHSGALGTDLYFLRSKSVFLDNLIWRPVFDLVFIFFILYLYFESGTGSALFMCLDCDNSHRLPPTFHPSHHFPFSFCFSLIVSRMKKKFHLSLLLISIFTRPSFCKILASYFLKFSCSWLIGGKKTL